MTTFLLPLLRITIGSCLTALAIILVRVLFQRFLSPKAKYYLWLILAIRLCLPVLPGSPTSIMNYIPQKGIVLETVQELPVVTPAVSRPESVSAPEDVPPAVISQPTPAETAPDSPPEQRSLSRNTVILIIWLAGMGISLITQIILYSLTGAALKQLPMCNDDSTIREFLALKRSLGFHGYAELRVGGAGMSGGLLRPIIVIPGDAQGESARPILLHELLHIRSGDLLFLAFYRILCAIHWYNPVVWLSFWQLKRDCEIANDQRVLETGLVSPVDYATTLYVEGIAAMIFGSAHFGGNDHNIKTRIALISKYKKPAISVTILAAILSLTICACTMTDAYDEDSKVSDEPQAVEAAEYQDFLGFIQSHEPPMGRYGYTFQEHVSQGLLDPQAGVYAEDPFETQGYPFDTFTTTMELGELEVEVVYLFGQHVLSDEKVLRQVFVNLPEGTNVEEWLQDIYDPYLTGLEEDSRYYSHAWVSRQFVASYMTSAQIQETASALASSEVTAPPQEGNIETLEQALNVLSNSWRVVSCFYTEEDNCFQFNGTGAALIVAANRDATASAGTLEATISRYRIPYGEFGMTYEEMVSAGYLTPEACEIQNETELSTVYETEIPIDGESVEASFVFSTTQFTVLSDQKQVLSEISLRIPTSADKDSWIKSISAPWAENMYGGFAVQFYQSPETVVDFLTTDQQHLAATQAAENGFADSYDQAQRDLEDWLLAQYYVQYDRFIFNGTGIALCRTAPVQDAVPGEFSVPAFYTVEGDLIRFRNAQWGTDYEQVYAAENLSPEWLYSDSSKPQIIRSDPLPEHPEVSSIAYRFDYTAPTLSYVLSNVEVKYDASQVSYDDLVMQRAQELGAPEYRDEDKSTWRIGSCQFQVQSGKKTLREWLSSSIINAPLSNLDSADWDSFFADLQPPYGEYGLTYEEHIQRGLLGKQDGKYESQTEIMSIYTADIPLGGYTLTAEYVFSETLALRGTGKRVLTQVNVTLPKDVGRSKWISSIASPWMKHMLGQSETCQWYTPYTLDMMLTQAQQDDIVQQMIAQGIVETEAEGYDYLKNWRLAANRTMDNNSIFMFNGTGIALYRSANDVLPQ